MKLFEILYPRVFVLFVVGDQYLKGHYLANVYLFKLNKGNNEAMCEKKKVQKLQ